MVGKNWIYPDLFCFQEEWGIRPRDILTPFVPMRGLSRASRTSTSDPPSLKSRLIVLSTYTFSIFLIDVNHFAFVSYLHIFILYFQLLQHHKAFCNFMVTSRNGTGIQRLIISPLRPESFSLGPNSSILSVQLGDMIPDSFRYKQRYDRALF